MTAPSPLEYIGVYEMASLRRQWNDRFNTAMRGRLFEDGDVPPTRRAFYSPALRPTGLGRSSAAWATG